MDEDRVARSLLIVPPDDMLDRQRRTVQLSRDATTDFVHAAVTHQREFACSADDPVSLLIPDLREVHPPRHLILVLAEESLHAAEEKADPPLTVREYKTPGRQPATSPTLNRFTGDVEP